MTFVALHGLSAARGRDWVRRGLAAGAAVLAVTAALVAQAPPGHAVTGQPQPGRLGAPAAATRAGGIPALALSGAGRTALKLSWSPAPGAVHYRISWYDHDSNATWQSQPDYTAEDSPVTLTGLTPGHTYTVSVRPFDAAGLGGVGWDQVSVTRATEGGRPPGARPGVASIALARARPTELKVSWSPAPGATRYRIMWYDQDVYHYQLWSSTPDYQAGDSPVTLTGLLPGRDYMVYVVPVDDAGDGAWATAITATRPDPRVTPPGATTLQVTPGASKTLKVSWTPAAGATRYRIHWENSARSSWTSAAPDYQAGDSPVTLTGLDGGIPTLVTVTPYNAGGVGPEATARATPVAS